MTAEVETYISRLVPDDIGALENIENATGLNFWGAEHYRRLLLEPAGHFGCKASLASGPGPHAVVGFFLARAVLETLEILKVGVVPELQTRGIGSNLMAAAYAEGRRRGCQRCFLEVRKSNEHAVRFYAGQEFRIAGSRQDYYTNPVEDAWVMQREL